MRFILFLLLAGAMFYGCQSGGDSAMQTSELGNRFQLFTAEGSGDKVIPGDFVYFHAAMRTEKDSTLFSTRDGGGELPVIQAAQEDATSAEIGPVEDVIRKMRVGDSAVVRVNIDSFPQKPPGMENDSVVLYDVVITEIVSEADFTARQEAKQAEAEEKAKLVRALEPERLAFAAKTVTDYRDGKLDEDIKATASGLKYIIHEEGSGPHGIAFQLGTGRVIRGWDEGIALLKEGGKATFFIPSELGYGPQGTPDGSIPGDSELVFYVELEEVQ